MNLGSGLLLLMAFQLPLFYPCKSEGLGNIPLVLKTLVNHLMDIMQKLQDLHTRMQNLEEMRISMEQCASRDQVAEFQDLITKDECKDQSHNCSVLATCQDHLVNYACKCFEGYEGDGFTCEDIDECSENLHGCPERSTCFNIPGNYTCTCQEGFQMLNGTCQDINECESGNSSCHYMATCHNTIGNFTCECGRLYRGDGRFCEGPFCEWPYSLLEGVGCFYYVTQKLTWNAAKLHCEDNNGRLYEADTAAEYLSLAKHIKDSHADDFIHVGVTGGKWAESGKVVANELWRYGDPDDGVTATGYMRKASSYLLGDSALNYSWKSLCEIPM